MTSFLTKTLEIFRTRIFHKIVSAHRKFGLVRIKGSKVKGGRIPPPLPVRVFEIPAWIGLRQLLNDLTDGIILLSTTSSCRESEMRKKSIFVV